MPCPYKTILGSQKKRGGLSAAPELRFTPCPLLLLFALFSALRVRIGFGVVLVVVNLAALPVLLVLDLVMLCTRQVAAIR